MKWWNDYPYITGVSFLHSKKYKSVDLVLGGNVDFDHGYLGAPMPGSAGDTIPSRISPINRCEAEKYRFNFNIRKEFNKHIRD